MAELIITVICALLAVLCLIYGIFAWHYRGPILMNKYLLASEEEKRTLARQPKEERNADYRYAAKISFGIALIWFLAGLGIIIDIRIMWLAVITAIVLVIYALAELFWNSRT